MAWLRSVLSEEEEAKLEPLFRSVQEAVALSGLVLAAWALGRAMSVVIVKTLLTERAQGAHPWPRCPVCGTGLESKGFRSREVLTLLGIIGWRRRVGRCPQRCAIGQTVPSDDALELSAGQKTSAEVQAMGCALVVFVPFAVATRLLGLLTGVEVSPAATWHWVQQAGTRAMQQLEGELQALAQGRSPGAELLEPDVARLPLLVGADGVMVPFRPHRGTPRGKTVWREVKVGILARLGWRMTRKRKKVARLFQRRLVAVRGNAAQFRVRLDLESLRQGVKTAPQVVWISDGGRWLWGIFRRLYGGRAIGILDFYHAAQNLWKRVEPCFVGNTPSARVWFRMARRCLRRGQSEAVLQDLLRAMEVEGLPKTARHELMLLHNYLKRHHENIDYARFKEMGLPLGSGMVESACKWLIQQRFKGVGMRWSEEGFAPLLHLRLAWVNSRFLALFPGAFSPSPNW
jgi:hypothetical protein